MQRIDPPAAARPPKTSVQSQAAQEYFEPRLADLEQALLNELVRFIQDPECTMQGAEDGFPRREELGGTYYFGDLRYHEDGQFLWLAVRLHVLDQAGERYLGIEALAGLNRQAPEAGWSLEGFEPRVE